MASDQCDEQHVSEILMCFMEDFRCKQITSVHLFVEGAHLRSLLIAEDRGIDGPNEAVFYKLIRRAHITDHIPVCRVDHLYFRVHNLQQTLTWFKCNSMQD